MKHYQRFFTKKGTVFQQLLPFTEHFCKLGLAPLQR